MKKDRNKSLQPCGRQSFHKYNSKRKICLRKQIDKLDLIKIKNFHSPKDIINKMKNQATHRQIFENAIANKGLSSRICKELLTTQ